MLTNPGFETGNLSSSANGPYTLTGWEGTNLRYGGHFIGSGTVAAGTVTQGNKKLVQTWGGTLNTAVSARVLAAPGATFLLRYDQVARVRNFPAEKLGSFRYIEFFDAAGVLLKKAYGTASDYVVQDTGKDLWQTFSLRATAPVNTASMGVRVDSPAGAYVGNTSYEDDRSVEYDNFSLTLVPETVDRLAYRRAPRLVEPGKNATLRIHHVCMAPRVLEVGLVNAAGIEVAISSMNVAKGRFLNTSLVVPIPAGLANGTYEWRIRLRASAAAPELVFKAIPGVFVNETVALPAAGAIEFLADHPNVQYMGRIENLANGSRWLHWFGSEVRLRFSGTSATLRGSVNDNGFGGAVPGEIIVVVDDNFAAAVTLPLTSFNFTQPLVTGLPNGVHTLRIFKSNETDKHVRIDAIRVDAGKGLLLPEPLPARKIEIFGDSVTSGGNATPTLGGYAPLLGRELDADVHIISKAGSGVAASFSGVALLGDYYDNLTFPNAFDGSVGQAWNFSQWTPNLIVIGIGHNDQFNGGAITFPAKYLEFKTKLRNDYPALTPILSANTLISAPLGHFTTAVMPLVAGDPNHRLAFQPFPWETQVNGHPSTAGHAAQVNGDVTRFSQAAVIEEMLGASLPPAVQLDAYQQWVTEQFTTAQIAAGDYALLGTSADGEASNLLRFALGVPATGAFPPSKWPTLQVSPLGNPSFRFDRASGGVNYTVQSSNDLSTWQNVGTNLGQVGTTVEYIEPSTTSQVPCKFYRLQVTYP